MMEGTFVYLLLAGVGVLAGFLNVMAGGGSLLALPVLLFAGMPAPLANGTNRVAILVQNIVAVDSFRRNHVKLDPRAALKLALPTLPGALAGALAATAVPDAWFRVILAVVIVIATVGLFAPQMKPGRSAGVVRWPAMAAMVLIGFYGGFIHAGVGFPLMMVLFQLVGFDLVRTNAHKVLVVGVYTLPALAVFVWSDNVDWLAGGALAIGNATGGMIGARVTVRGGDRAIKAVVAVALAAMAWKLVS